MRLDSVIDCYAAYLSLTSLWAHCVASPYSLGTWLEPRQSACPPTLLRPFSVFYRVVCFMPGLARRLAAAKVGPVSSPSPSASSRPWPFPSKPNSWLTRHWRAQVNISRSPQLEPSHPSSHRTHVRMHEDGQGRTQDVHPLYLGLHYIAIILYFDIFEIVYTNLRYASHTCFRVVHGSGRRRTAAPPDHLKFDPKEQEHLQNENKYEGESLDCNTQC